MITMTPEMFGGRTYDGIAVETVGDDEERYVSIGHIDPVAFAAAALQHSRYLVGSDDIDASLFYPPAVEHRWGILTDPSGWPSPDDWEMRWCGVEEETPGAFPVTILTID